MSEQSTEPQAWLWYEPKTLILRHVGFNADADHGQDLAKIAMHLESAMNVMSGKSRLTEYELVLNDSGELELIYRKQPPPFKKFWQLVDATKNMDDDRFDDAKGRTSPVNISYMPDEFIVVDVISKAKNIVFYITMRNDPNYLIKKIELYPYAQEQATVTGIRIPVGVSGDYSVYVRYDAA